MATVPNRSKEERFRFIEDHAINFSVRYLCVRLGVSPSGYYKWRKHKPNRRENLNQCIAQRIIDIFHDHNGNYGSPRITRALRNQGERVNHKRVERIMQRLGLIGKAAQVYRRKALPERFFDKFANLRFESPEPAEVNMQWVGDVTYLKVADKHHFLATIMDVYSKKIVGWAL